MSARINCHSGYIHYNRIMDRHCHGGDVIGSVFNITNYCGGGHTTFWGGFGAGIGQGLGAGLMGLLGGFTSCFSMMPSFMSGFNMMPPMFNFWGGGGAGNGYNFGTNNIERDYSEYSSDRSCDCKCKCKHDGKDEDDDEVKNNAKQPEDPTPNPDLNFEINNSVYKTGFKDCTDEDLSKLTVNNVKSAQDVPGQSMEPPIRDVEANAEGDKCIIENNGKTIKIKDKDLANQVEYNYIGKTKLEQLVYKDEESGQVYILQKKGSDPNIEYHLMQYDGMNGAGEKAHSSTK